MTQTFFVEEGDKGDTLHRFLIKKLAGVATGKEIKRWLEGQLVSVNGKLERFGSFGLLPGDKVVVQETKAQESGSVKTLFENSDFLAIEKWPGLVCENATVQKYVPGVTLIHRLDRGTSGILLLAKNETVRKRFIEAFRQKKIKKTYIAICQGVPSSGKGIIKDYLFQAGKIEGQTLWSSRREPPGDYAETQWTILEQANGISLVQCMPITGRTHQLRVHLKSLGIPILGDPLYNTKKSKVFVHRLMLHAWKLSIPPEIAGKEIYIESELPEDFKID